jgi:hypothetical protein
MPANTYQRFQCFVVEPDGSHRPVGRAHSRVQALAKLSGLLDPPSRDGALAADGLWCGGDGAVWRYWAATFTRQLHA